MDPLGQVFFKQFGDQWTSTTHSRRSERVSHLQLIRPTISTVCSWSFDLFENHGRSTDQNWIFSLSHHFEHRPLDLRRAKLEEDQDRPAKKNAISSSTLGNLYKKNENLRISTSAILINQSTNN